MLRLLPLLLLGRLLGQRLLRLMRLRLRRLCCGATVATKCRLQLCRDCCGFRELLRKLLRILGGVAKRCGGVTVDTTNFQQPLRQPD